MKKIYTFCLVMIIAVNANSQPVIEWQKSFGGSGNDLARSIKQTTDGGYIVFGETNSNDGDVIGLHNTYPGNPDYWIIKLTYSGSLQWSKCLGGMYNEYGYSVNQTLDGGYILAGEATSNDGDIVGNIIPGGGYWIVKIDSSGNIQWQKMLGGTASDEAYDIKQTTDGGYIVVGYSVSNDYDVSGNHGMHDYWVVKLNSNGNIQWQKSLGGQWGEVGHEILQTNDGGYIINGRASSNNGDLVGSGFHGGADYWVVKLDFSGNIQWQKAYGGSHIDWGRSIKQTYDNGFIIGGSTFSTDGDVTGNNGGFDYWLLKIDSVGTIQWKNCYGGSLSDSAFTVITTLDSGYVMCGYSNSTNGNVTGNHGDYDYWIIKVDSIGNVQWNKCLGGLGFDLAYSIDQTYDGGFVIAGYSNSNDGDVSGNKGNLDFWVVKLSSEYNAITGNLFIDLNSNSLQDINEHSFSNQTAIEANTGRLAISDVNGFYNLSVLDTGNFSVSPSPLLHYTGVPASHSAYFSAINQTDSLNNFAFQPNGIINDLQVTINPVGAFRPGFNAHYNIHYKNVGTTSISGSVIFKPDSVLNYVSSPTTPVSIMPDSVVWNIPTLNPFDEGNILVTVSVSSGAVLGSTVSSVARIEPVASDAIPSDNESTWPVTVTGSYDPNDILVNRETVTTTELMSPPYLDYLIRFQNTGTDTAFTVKIKNPLPVNATLNTFEFLESSHPVQLNYSNPEQLMWFQFDNILLPDSNTNESLSQGHVRYRIKPKSTLTVGDSILNSASIFFDFNAPIYTNTAVTEIVLGTSVPGIKNNFDFSIYPNPSTGNVNISFALIEEKEIKIKLFNSLGQIVKTISQQKFTSGKNQINFSTENISKGIYHIKFSVDESVSVKRLVKM